MWRGGRVLILVAHPDDETLGCGGQLPHWPDCVIVHLTDGSPADLADARHAGFQTSAEYAAARRAELHCALALVGGRETRSLGLTDQQTWRDLDALTRSVRALLHEIRPAAILTHPYEGGHPDHDAAAFAVQFACLDLPSAPARIEAAFYNRYGGRFHPGEFLPGPDPVEIALLPEDQLRKRRMFDCFRSQQRVLDLFGVAVERFRPAPVYDFSRPPHEGPLNYETLPWNIAQAQWIEAAARARRALLP